MKKKYVVFISIFTFLLIIGFDIYLYSDDVPRNSISQIIIDTSTVSSMVPALIGFLFGGLLVHWFDNYTQK